MSSKVWCQTTKKETVFIPGSFGIEEYGATWQTVPGVVDGYIDNDAYGNGFTVAYVSTGIYDVTLDVIPTNYISSKACIASKGTADFRVVETKLRTVTAANRSIIRLQVINSSGTLTEITTEETVHFLICVEMSGAV